MQRFRGFTFIEIMIVVAIVGILAAIAWPAYQQTIMKTNRSEAKTELTDLAQRLQKCYTTYGRYDDPPGDDMCAAYDSVSAADGYTTRGRGFYTITIAAGGSGNVQSSFVLTATATLAPQTNDTGGNCDQLTLSNTGQKGPLDCW